MCGPARVLVPALLVGLAVSTVSGSDAAAWIAIGITIAASVIAARMRGRTIACGFSAPAEPRHDDATLGAA
jgi:hypothetical protein